MKQTILLTSLALAFGANAASVVINPASIAYITTPAQELTGLNLDNENNIINGNGLSAPLTVANIASVTHADVTFDAPGNAWVTTDPGGYPSDFFASGGNAPVFTIDLGGIFNVTDFVIWGYHFGANNGNHPKNLLLEFSQNGGASYGAPVGIEVPNAGAYNSADVITFAGETANYVRMTVTDNFYGIYSGGDRVGIAEIRFMGDAVPEPSVGCLGALGALLLFRRRR